MLELLLRPAYLAPTVLLFGWVLYHVLKPSKSTVPDIPILGLRDGDWFFPMARAGWRNALDFKRANIEADAKYRDQPVLVPFPNGPFVLLPRVDIQDVSAQPESVLNMHDTVIELLKTEYTIMNQDLVRRPIHHHIITTTLTSQIGNLIPEVLDEVTWNFEQHWGSSKEWKDVALYPTMRRIIGGVTNRIFCGLPICRDPALVDLAMAYAQEIPVMGMILNLLPKWTHPLLGPLISLPARIHNSRFLKLLRPVVEQRLKDYEARRADPEANKQLGPEPNDLLQWMIEQAKTLGEPHLWSPDVIAGRILLVNFAAIHTTTFSITGTILDLIYSHKPEYIAELREEITSVLAEHDGQWNKRSIAQMHKLDSTLRESTRLNGLTTIALNRIVAAPEGYDTPSGMHLPKGTAICVPAYTVMHDREIYGEDADSYSPFRFAVQRSDQSVEYVQRARKAFPATSHDFLAFGHGRSPCPGRFFAASELKILLGHILMNYDLEMPGDGKERPENSWIWTTAVPPLGETVRIRRREKT